MTTRKKIKKRSLEYYYKNREKRLKAQREYDQKNKEKKKEYDQKRRKLKGYNRIKRTQQYSTRNHFPILLKKYGECMFCQSKNKLEIHHKKYDTKEIKDCLLLCQKCHKIIHRK